MTTVNSFDAGNGATPQLPCGRELGDAVASAAFDPNRLSTDSPPLQLDYSMIRTELRTRSKSAA